MPQGFQIATGDACGRQRLSRDIPPVDSIEVATEFPLDGFEVGRYCVLVDMVNERVCWFQDMGSEVADRWIEIMKPE
jgi:hypothetical protein